jgi:hypothetical protein
VPVPGERAADCEELHFLRSPLSSHSTRASNHEPATTGPLHDRSERLVLHVRPTGRPR